MKHQLNDKVWIITEEVVGSSPCPTCKLSNFEMKTESKEVKISDILTHSKSYDEPNSTYRVRVDEEIELPLVWYGEDQIFLTREEAEAEIKRSKHPKEEESDKPTESTENN